MFSSTLLRPFIGAVSILFMALATYSSGQSIVKVGMQPLAIIQVGSNAHVFCNGFDKNFNSIYEPDSGEIAASWWVIDTQTRSVLMHREFTDRYLPFPFRIDHDKSKEAFLFLMGTD
ncbi:MAG: hypothetical protein IPM69_04305 [Ignavibacteria bacterium]|nr:hypothetical protein [Ignavibacteria bacterium]